MGGAGRGKECVQVERELQRAGGFGIYQWLVCLIIISGMMSGGFIMHGIAYLELAPNMYQCYDGTQYTQCTPEQFCNQTDPGPIYDKNSVDYVYTEGHEPNQNIYNWYTKLGLVCNPNQKKALAMIATLALLGVSLSCLFIPRMGDLYGRKPMYMFALGLQIPVFIMICLVDKMLLIYVLAFLLGPTITGRMACGFLLLIEMVPKKNQSWVGASLMVAEGSCAIIWTAYFVWISRNAFYFVYFDIGLSFLSLVGCFYVTESPRYLFGMEKFEECRKVLVTIARRNGVKDYTEPSFEDENIILVESTEDVLDRINPSGPLRTSEPERNFEHLLVPNPEDPQGRKTRYMTNTRQTQALTKRESVANMHERATGWEYTQDLYLAGVDRTQSIALDEIFGKKIVDSNGQVRTTKTYRKSRVTQANSQTGDSEVVKLSQKSQQLEIGSPKIEDGEIVVVPVKVTRGQGLCHGDVFVSLMTMILMWICTSVNYMIINIYLKYIPGSEFLNFTVAGFAEIAAHLSVGYLFGKFGFKVCFIIGYTIALAGGICLIFQNQFLTNNTLVASFVLFAKFGASMTMCVCQISTPFIFPPLLCGTAFGICNLFGRFCQAGSPIIVELQIPLPMEIFTGFATIALVASIFIKQDKQQVEQQQNQQ